MKRPTAYSWLFPRVNWLYSQCWPHLRLFDTLLFVYLWWHDWTRHEWEHALTAELNRTLQRMTR